MLRRIISLLRKKNNAPPKFHKYQRRTYTFTEQQSIVIKDNVIFLPDTKEFADIILLYYNNSLVGTISSGKIYNVRTVIIIPHENYTTCVIHANKESKPTLYYSFINKN
jgi:hypothetical protein